MAVYEAFQSEDIDIHRGEVTGKSRYGFEGGGESRVGACGALDNFTELRRVCRGKVEALDPGLPCGKIARGGVRI